MAVQQCAMADLRLTSNEEAGQIAEVLDELAQAYDGRVKVAKVNIDQNRATAIKYHVRSIPMLLLFKDGQIQASQVGAVGKGQLTQMIDKTLAA